MSDKDIEEIQRKTDARREAKDKSKDKRKSTFGGPISPKRDRSVVDHCGWVYDSKEASRKNTNNFGGAKHPKTIMFTEHEAT